jgi:hypothetical protein
VNAGNWISLAGVIIAGVSAILAVLSARRARKAESAAAEHERQALEAARDAAGHAKRSADAEERVAGVAESQERRQSEEIDAVDADPWMLEPIPGEDNCYLINRSKSPKYGVSVAGLKVHNGPAQFDAIGPGKRKELSVMRIYHPDDSIQITWYRKPDHSDAPQTRPETIPSRL